MATFDRVNTFCLVRFEQTETTLVHNNRFLVDNDTQQLKKPRRLMMRETPPAALPPKLALRLDDEVNWDRGHYFGSDEKSDILLLETNETGVSALHFRLSFDFSYTSATPKLLSLHDMSRHGTVVNSKRYSKDESFHFRSGDIACVTAGSVSLEIEFLSGFDEARWNDARRKAQEEVPSLSSMRLARYVRETPNVPSQSNKWSSESIPWASGERYEIEQVVGKGKYGSVRRLRRLRDGKMLAVKIISSAFKDHGQKELAVMQGLNSDYVCRLVDHAVYSDLGPVCIVQELAECGDLRGYFAENGRRLPEEVCRTILSQILDGLCHLHCQQIVHRDINMDNIVVFRKSPTLLFKITDFSHAFVMKDGKRPKALTGSLPYIAPEVAQATKRKSGSVYNEKVDVWSLGAVIFHLLSGESGVQKCEASEIASAIRQWEPSATLQRIEMKSEARSLLLWMLTRSPEQRPSAEACMRSEWFDDSNTPATLAGSHCERALSPESVDNEDDLSTLISATQPGQQGDGEEDLEQPPLPGKAVPSHKWNEESGGSPGNYDATSFVGQGEITSDDGNGALHRKLLDYRLGLSSHPSLPDTDAPSLKEVRED